MNGYLLFSKNFLDLLNGNTIYTYIVGSPEKANYFFHLTISILITLSVVTSSIYLKVVKKVKLPSILPGFLISLLGFYLLTGNAAIAPHQERYAMWIVVPALYLLFTLIELNFKFFKLKKLISPSIAVIGALMLVSFAANYIIKLNIYNSTSHKTFLTGAEEPKLKTIKEIERVRDHNKNAVILTEDWWTYWALRYLSVNSQNLFVTIIANKWDERFPPDFKISRRMLLNSQLYYVCYTKGALDQKLRASPRLQKLTDISGIGGQKIISIYERKL